MISSPLFFADRGVSFYRTQLSDEQSMSSQIFSVRVLIISVIFFANSHYSLADDDIREPLGLPSGNYRIGAGSSFVEIMTFEIPDINMLFMIGIEDSLIIAADIARIIGTFGNSHHECRITYSVIYGQMVEHRMQQRLYRHAVVGYHCAVTADGREVPVGKDNLVTVPHRHHHPHQIRRYERVKVFQDHTISFSGLSHQQIRDSHNQSREICDENEYPYHHQEEGDESFHDVAYRTFRYTARDKQADSNRRCEQPDGEIDDHDHTEMYRIDTQRSGDRQKDRCKDDHSRTEIEPGPDEQQQSVHDEQKNKPVGCNTCDEVSYHPGNSLLRKQPCQRRGGGDHKSHLPCRKGHFSQHLRNVSELELLVVELSQEEGIESCDSRCLGGSEDTSDDSSENYEYCHQWTKASNSPKGTISFFLPPSVHRTDRISQPFYSTLFYHTEREARAKGYACFYSTLDEHDDFESMLKRQRFDGIIFVSNVSEKFIEMAKEFHIPCVLVNEYNPHILSYMVDNITGMMNLCEYLIDLGHRRFALIKGIESYLSCQERMIGCTYAFAKNNIAPPPSVSCDWEPDTAYQATKEFLLSAETLPTAMVGFNDNIAIGCLRAANELGLRVPQDISIVGFDDIEQSRYSIPALTTVHGSIQQLAISTIQGLLYQIQNSQTLTTLKTYIPVSLVIRDSAAPPPAHPVGSVRG